MEPSYETSRDKRARSVNEPSINLWWGLSDRYKCAFHVLPLALAALIISLLFLAWGVFDILYPIIGPRPFTWDQTGDVVTGVFKVTVALGGLIALSKKKRGKGLRFLIAGYNIFVVSQAVALTTRWLEWTLALGGITTPGNIKWKPNSEEIKFMILYTIGTAIVIFISVCCVLGWLESLSMIFCVGGTGWESCNYIEILIRQHAAKVAAAAPIAQLEKCGITSEARIPQQKQPRGTSYSRMVPILNSVSELDSEDDGNQRPLTTTTATTMPRNYDATISAQSTSDTIESVTRNFTAIPIATCTIARKLN